MAHAEVERGARERADGDDRFQQHPDEHGGARGPR
jgi:hypothetical protein